MTVLVVANGKVYVDSLSGRGNLRQVDTKIGKSTLGTWACAGWVNWAKLAIEAAERSPDLDKFKCPVEDPDRSTDIVLRAKNRKVYALSVVKDAEWRELPSDEELSFVSGAGADYFMAYWGMLKDVQKAMELTAEFHYYCGPPIRTF